jgi:hypothetical protein
VVETLSRSSDIDHTLTGAYDRRPGCLGIAYSSQLLTVLTPLLSEISPKPSRRHPELLPMSGSSDVIPDRSIPNATVSLNRSRRSHGNIVCVMNSRANP